MKNILVYLIIFITTLLISGGLFVYVYYYYMPSLSHTEQHDSELENNNGEIVENIAGETVVQTDQRQHEQHVFDDMIRAGLPEHERYFIDLLQQVRALNMRHTAIELDIEAEEHILALHAEMDSTLIAMIAQNDSLKSVVINQLVNINALHERNTRLSDDFTSLEETINFLQGTITDLRNEIQFILTPPEEDDVLEEIEFDFMQLARLYNNMDNNRVSLLLQGMEAEHAIEILRLMNRRKVAQLMGIFPPNIAAEFSYLLLKN